MDTGASSDWRTTRLQFAEYRAVMYAVPPLIVLIIANLLFELAGGVFGLMGSHVGATPPGPNNLSRDAVASAAALHWATLALVYLCVMIGTAIGAWRVISARVRGSARWPFIVFAICVGALGLAHLAVVDATGAPLRALYAVTHDALHASAWHAEQPVELITGVVAAINVLSPIVTAGLFAGGAALALPPQSGWDEASLYRHTIRVRRFVNVAAVFLVSGILHMAAWTHWAGAMLSTKADVAMDQVAVAAVLFWGTTFTLMIGSYYLPVILQLSEIANGVMNDAGIPTADRRRWLADRGLSFRFTEQLPQVVAMLAPLIAGPLSATISGVAKTLSV